MATASSRSILAMRDARTSSGAGISMISLRTNGFEIRSDARDKASPGCGGTPNGQADAPETAANEFDSRERETLGRISERPTQFPRGRADSVMSGVRKAVGKFSAAIGGSFSFDRSGSSSSPSCLDWR